MNLQPLDDRIVVKPGESEETTASGLVIPDTAKEKPQQGEVLAVGPGKRSEQTGEIIPLDIAVGDTVVYSKYGGTEITSDNEDFLILTSRDVLAKVGKTLTKKKQRTPRCPRSSSSTTPPCAAWRPASTSWPTPSKSPSARAAATSCSTRSPVLPPSPTTASPSPRRWSWKTRSRAWAPSS